MSLHDNGTGLKLQEELTAGYRTLCLGLILLRGQAEHRAHEDPRQGLFNGAKKRVDRWMEDEGIDCYLSAREALLLGQPVGYWTSQEIIDASWRTEALGVLLWSLGVVEGIPPYDRAFQPGIVLLPLRLLRPSGDYFKRVRLRPLEEINRARDLAELWHWRSRTTRIQQEGVQPPDGWTFSAILSSVSRAAYEEGDTGSPIKGDLPLFGKPYHSLTEEEYMLATSIAVERHYALNWLSGYAEDWDKVPTDT